MRSNLIRREGRIFAKKKLLVKELSYVDPTDKTVFEIGGGDGRLTDLLINNDRKPRNLIVIEKDKRLCEALRLRFRDYDNVKVVCEDIREYRIPHVDVIIGNVPYYLSSYIMRTLKDVDFEVALLTFQKEFAEKLIARPGDRNYGKVSVIARTWFDVEYLETVKPNWFVIRPGVDSAIVRIKKKQVDVPVCYYKLVNLLFQRRRKTLRKALLDVATQLPFDSVLIDKVFPKDLLKERVFKLSVERLKEVAKVMETWTCSSTGEERKGKD